MKVMQEETVRQLHLKGGLTELSIEQWDYITPQAMDYIREKGLALVTSAPENPEIRTAIGQSVEKKPEHMTHLHSNVLVPKGHPRIRLRGRLDSLQADIILLQTQTDAAGETDLTAELDEVLAHCRSIMRCEVTGEPLDGATLLGLDEGALRAQSQQPKLHFGVGHLLPDYRLGAVFAALNRLRAQAREVELAAIDAFCPPEGGAVRTDLLQALNRLSSAFYILMLRREKRKG